MASISKIFDKNAKPELSRLKREHTKLSRQRDKLSLAEEVSLDDPDFNSLDIRVRNIERQYCSMFYRQFRNASAYEQFLKSPLINGNIQDTTISTSSKLQEEMLPIIPANESFFRDEKNIIAGYHRLALREEYGAETFLISQNLDGFNHICLVHIPDNIGAGSPTRFAKLIMNQIAQELKVESQRAMFYLYIPRECGVFGTEHFGMLRALKKGDSVNDESIPGVEFHRLSALPRPIAQLASDMIIRQAKADEILFRTHIRAYREFQLSLV